MKIYRSPYVLLFYIVTIWCAIEFIISPNPYAAKLRGSFPAFRYGLTFDLSEILIFLFIFLSCMLLIGKIIIKNRLSLGPRVFELPFSIFALSLLGSILIGFISKHPEFFTMLRVTSPLILILIFLNTVDISKHYLKVIQIMYITGCIIILLNILFLVIPEYVLYAFAYNSVEEVSKNKWFGLFLLTFVFSISLNKIIWKESPAFHLVIVGCVLFVVISNITVKPIVLACAVVAFSSFVFVLKSKKQVARLFILTFILVSGSVSTLISLPEKNKDQIAVVFAQRFLKQTIEHHYELGEAFDNIEVGKGSDVFSGRLDLWKGYLSEATKSPIISSSFGDVPNIYVEAVHRKVNWNAHNSVVYYAYYIGYPAAISLLFMMLGFIYMTASFRGRKRLEQYSETYNISKGALYGSITFIYGIMAVEMIGGPLSNAKFSWFFYIIAIFLLKGLVKRDSVYKGKRYHLAYFNRDNTEV